MAFVDPYVYPLPDKTGELVTARFGMSENLVNSYSAESSSALDALSGIVFQIPLENIDFNFDDVTPPNIGDAPVPTAPEPYVDPSKPASLPDLEALRGLLGLVDIVLDDTPIPTLAIQPPAVEIPDAPDDAIPEIPDDVPAITDKELPPAPTITLPPDPVIEDTILPAVPEIDLPTFEGDLPTVDLTPPEPMFIYQDQSYQSDLADAIKTKLYNDVVNGGTGLDADVEQDIWDRALSRLNIELDKAYQQTLTNWAAWNNDMPDGILAGALQEVLFENNRTRLDLNRDIAYKQADLAQQNTQFAITSGLVYEKQMMDFINQINNRAFEVARYRIQSEVDKFNIRITAYNAQLQRFEAIARVFESRVRAELAKVEIYRAQMEGAKIHGDLQAQKVMVYTQRVNALRAIIDMYNSQLEAVRTQIAVDNLKIDAFKARLDAAVARINGVTTKYNLYQAQIAGETSKVDLYARQVDAFSSEVQAAKVLADVNLAKMQALIDQNRDKYALLSSAVEVYKADTQYELGKGDVSARVYTAQTGRYEAEVQRETDYLRSKIEKYKAEITEIATEAELAIKEMDVNLRAALAAKELQVEALKATAGFQAQKIASALSSVSASAQLGYNGSVSGAYSLSDSYVSSHSESDSTGIQTNYNYIYSE